MLCNEEGFLHIKRDNNILVYFSCFKRLYSIVKYESVYVYTEVCVNFMNRGKKTFSIRIVRNDVVALLLRFIARDLIWCLVNKKN